MKRQHVLIGLSYLSLIAVLLVSTVWPSSAQVVSQDTSSVAGAFGAPLYRYEVLGLNPLIYLRFNGNFLDSSKTGSYPGIPTEGVTFGAGIPLIGDPRNEAASFNGISGVVTIPGTANLSFTEQATLTAWVKFNKLPSETDVASCDSGKCVTIVAKSGFALDLDLQAEDDNRFHFYVGVGNPNKVSSRTTIVAGRWYFVAATYRRGIMEIYVNGFLEGFRDNPEVTREENSNDFAVGGNMFWQTRFLPGLIDEVAIFQKALTAAQINKLYRSVAGMPGLCM